MANRQSARRNAMRHAARMLTEIGRELRVGRITAGLRQIDVGTAIGRHASHVSRVEHGLLSTLSVRSIAEHAAVVGLRPWMRLYPAIARPLDRAQLALLEVFRERIDPAWKVDLEVPMPLPGDLRAADAVLSIPGCRCVVEVITRLADLQAQARAGLLKVRDLGADRLILVIASNTTNRRSVALAGQAVRDAFPITTRPALERLAAGQDPGGDCIIFLPSTSHALRRT